MTGLKSYTRDRNLPARAGDAELRPPDDVELLAHVRATLARSAAPPPDSAELVYARWKPRTALIATYAVGWADGAEELVTWKRHLGGKAAAIAATYTPDEHVLAHAGRLASFHADVSGASLFAFPADRELTGLARALDVQRLARLVAPLQPERVRWRRSTVHLLRYKPEHRAVFRLDLVLRDDTGALCERSLAVRVLPALSAARVQAARLASVERDAQTLGPALKLVELRTGLLVEEWLDATVPDSSDLSHAHTAGELLARLHGLPPPQHGDVRVRADHAELFACLPVLSALAARLPASPRSAARAWIHGDVHPDQLALARGADSRMPARLLDLDNLGPGLPAEDLAAWIADHLALRAGDDFEAASRELLAGYRAGGGTPPPDAELRAWTAQELRERAAAALRRLEVGAEVRALRLLEAATSVLA